MELPISTANEQTISADTRRHWLKRNWLWLAGVAVILMAAALIPFRFSFHAGYIEEDKKQASEMIAQFHQQMNAGRFEEIYAGTHPGFQNALSQQDWLKHMQDSRAQFGRFTTVKFSEINVILGPPIEIRAAYVSTFEKGEATELFSFAREGDKVRLLVYGIFPGNTFRTSHPSSKSN